jgi:hypothetical protein
MSLRGRTGKVTMFDVVSADSDIGKTSRTKMSDLIDLILGHFHQDKKGKEVEKRV